MSVERMLNGLHGSVTALVTPFRGSRVDEDALGHLVERQILRGTAALVACGSTGEAAALTLSEAARVVACVVEAARGRVPVIAGCTDSATEAASELAIRAVQAGADALLLAAPPYVKPTQEGIAAHVRAVAHATDRPVMLYDVPGRCGAGIADATIAKLFAGGLIFAVKDATADLSRPPRLRALCGEALAQFTGDDATTAAYRAMGGVGCVSVTANVTPALCAALHRSWEAGDLPGFARLRDMLDPLHAALFAESNPIPLKAAMGELALCADELRLPLTRAVEATRVRLSTVLAAIMPAEERAVPRPLWAVAM
ncbi:MAG TPA: 4-hydroxy-tetrahydrodipicolinate synthase [Acetobacteraceae bacterium]